MTQVFWAMSKPSSCLNCGSKSIYETSDNDGWACLACSRIIYFGRPPEVKAYREKGAQNHYERYQ